MCLTIILILICARLESQYYFFVIDGAHPKDLQTTTPDFGRSGSSRLYPSREIQGLIPDVLEVTKTVFSQ
jgi:hypothetical protein